MWFCHARNIIRGDDINHVDTTTRCVSYECIMKTASDIINVLGGNAKVADFLGVGASTVSEMKRRDSIPVEYFPAIIKAAERAGNKTLTLEKLVRIMASAKKRASKAAEMERAS